MIISGYSTRSRIGTASLDSRGSEFRAECQGGDSTSHHVLVFTRYSSQLSEMQGSNVQLAANIKSLESELTMVMP